MDIALLILRLALAGLLYAFLGALLLMLWRDLRKTVTAAATSRPRGRLVPIEGPSQATGGPSSPESFNLQPVSSIGRAPSNTVVLHDTYASSHHALLSWRESRWWLEDHDSRNGTFLNGERVAEPTLVASGDVIRIGQTKLRLEADETPS